MLTGCSMCTLPANKLPFPTIHQFCSVRCYVAMLDGAKKESSYADEALWYVQQKLRDLEVPPTLMEVRKMLIPGVDRLYTFSYFVRSVVECNKLSRAWAPKHNEHWAHDYAYFNHVEVSLPRAIREELGRGTIEGAVRSILFKELDDDGKRIYWSVRKRWFINQLEMLFEDKIRHLEFKRLVYEDTALELGYFLAFIYGINLSGGTSEKTTLMPRGVRAMPRVIL